MGQLTITFTGEPHELHKALAELGFHRTSVKVIGEPLNAQPVEDIVASLRNAAAPVAATANGFSTVQFGDTPEQLQHGTSDGKPAPEEPAETVTGPHSADEIRDALATTAKEEADRKKKEAADRRAKKAEAKRQEDAAARAAAAVNAVETDQAADPNGASLDALLSQDATTEIPEHLTEEAKAEAATAEPEADDDLSALLGETAPEVVEDDGRRAKFEAMSAEDLNAAIRDLMKKKGVPWLKNVLAEAKKSNLGQMTREEMVEVLVQVD